MMSRIENMMVLVFSHGILTDLLAIVLMAGASFTP
jgi:hypothetical protein